MTRRVDAPTPFDERGSATLHSLFAALLLLTALAAATLWSTISTARHRLSSAADLVALSAAHSTLTTPESVTPAGSSASAACTTAARIAAEHKVQLTACQPSATAVTVQVALQINLLIARPTLTVTARAGPV